MISGLPFLIEVFWKSGAVLGVALCLNILLRRRSADLRRLVLSTAIVAMLVAGLALPVLPRLTAVLPAWSHVRSASIPVIVEPADASPIPDGEREILPVSNLPPRPPHRMPAPIPLFWFAGASLLLIRFAIRLRGLHRLRNISTPMNETTLDVTLLQNEAIAAPVTWGIFRHVILVPTSFEQLPAESRSAVLCHELAHVQAHDFLMRVLSELACSLIWFQPLMWIARRQLREEQELACDNRVLAAGGKPSAYAKLLLDWESRLPRTDVSPAVGMVQRGSLKRRLHALLDPNLRRDVVSRKGILTALLLGFAAALPLAALSLIPWTPPPTAHAQTAITTPIQAVPIQMAQVRAAQVRTPPSASATTPPPAAATSKFTTVSLKSCSARGDRAGLSSGASSSGPAWLTVPCENLFQIINLAYARSDGPLLNNAAGPEDPQNFRGGPSWVYTDYYSIDATGESYQSAGSTMRGPMLQAFLEERFRLKIHRDVEDAAMYKLTVGPDGLKLQPKERESCPAVPPHSTAPLDSREMAPHDFAESVLEREKELIRSHACGTSAFGVNGPNRTYDASGVPLGRLASDLKLSFLHRYVFDETGSAGIFDIHLEFAPDANTPGGPQVDPNSGIAPGPSIFSAIEQLGLKLEPTTGPHGIVVIDHVERPSED